MGIYIFGLQSKISYSLLSNLTYKISSDQNTVKRLKIGRVCSQRRMVCVQASRGLEQRMGVPSSLRRVLRQRCLGLCDDLEKQRQFGGIWRKCFDAKSSSSCYHTSTYSWGLDSTFSPSPYCVTGTMPSLGEADPGSLEEAGHTLLTTVYLVLTSASGTYLLVVPTQQASRDTYWISELLNEMSNTQSLPRQNSQTSEGQKTVVFSNTEQVLIHVVTEAL